MAIPASRRYLDWKLKVIECIANEKRILAPLKIEEIKCVLRNDGGYPDDYLDGELPEESWAGEMGSIEDSQ